MNAQQAIEILQKLDPLTEVAITIGAQAPVVPPMPHWPHMTPPFHNPPWQPPFTVTSKYETQTTQTS